MASKKGLKKCIKLISIDLISECYVYYIFNPTKEKEINDIVNEVSKMNYDLVTRINHIDGKDDRKLVKKHFAKLKADWNKGVTETIDKIQSLNKK